MYVADKPDDLSLDTSGDEEEAEEEVEEEDVFQTYKQAHLEAAKAKSARPPPTKRLKSATAQTGLAPVTQPPPPPPQDQTRQRVSQEQPMVVSQEQPMMMVSPAWVENMITSVATSVAAQYQISNGGALQEAIASHTNALTEVVRSSTSNNDKETQLEPRLSDRSWWLDIKAHDIQDNSHNVL